jgi:hypothetical protein
MRLTDEHRDFLRSIPPDRWRLIAAGDPIIATQEQAERVADLIEYLGKHGLVEVRYFDSQPWCQSLDAFVRAYGCDGHNYVTWLFTQGICVRLTPAGERAIQEESTSLVPVSARVLEALYAFQYAGIPMSDEMRGNVGTLPDGRRVDHGTMRFSEGVPESWLIAYLLPEPVLEQQRLRAEVRNARPVLEGLRYVKCFTGTPTRGPCSFVRPDGVVVTIDDGGTGVRVGPYPQAARADVGSIRHSESSWLTLHQMVDVEGKPLAQSPPDTYWRLTRRGLAAMHSVTDKEAARAAPARSGTSADANQPAGHLPERGESPDDPPHDKMSRLNEIAQKLDEFAGRPTTTGLAGAAGLAGILLSEARKAGAFDPVTWIELDPCFRQYPAISSGAPLHDGRQLFACVVARLVQCNATAAPGCSFRPEPPHPGKSYDFDWLRETLGALAGLIRNEGARLGGYGSVANAPTRSGPDYDSLRLARHDGDDAGLDSSTPADESLSPSRVRARAVYEWAIEVIDGADRMPIAVLLPRIFERLDAELEKVPDGSAEFEKFTELRSSLPDNTETFGRYIREAGIKRYNRKGERVSRQARRPRQD